MPIFVPDLFSGYLQGRRAAIQDNWNDLTNYNETLDGQLQNAMSMETFDDAARMAHNASAISDLTRLSDSVDTALGLQKYQLGQDAGLPQKQIQQQVEYCDAMIKFWQDKKQEALSGQTTGGKVAGMDTGTQPKQTTVQPKAQTDAATLKPAVTIEQQKSMPSATGAPGSRGTFNFAPPQQPK